jgi:CubicO group peptidase (beta-lactamase class C family)
MSSTAFNPLKHGIPAWRITPSEDDDYFRHKVLRGYVHDMASAMMNGVSGHAGLFSNAEDLATLFQMLLNKGNFGGKQYFKPETVELFTSLYPPATRRGLGFDKPVLNMGKSVNTAYQCSPRTFGHTGFTGTYAFADPDYNLIFIFLSNRTYPTMNNNKLFNFDTRTKMHEAIYRALGRE